MARYDFDEKESTKATATVGVMTVIIVLLAAFAGWLWYDSRTDNPTEVTQKAEQLLDRTTEKAKDIGAEVPQAAKDATTEGDQNTTRPNKDGSTGNLDQK